MTNKQQRGQFFTVNEKVLQDLVSLLGDNPGKTLEPSAGAGHIMQAFVETFGKDSETNTIVGWELDTSVEPVSDSLRISYGDFFVQADTILPNTDNKLTEELLESKTTQSQKFNSIIGNPPFVAWKNIEEDSKISASFVKKEYSDKTNLYHLFIDRCIDLLEDDGQLVFIIPKEWIYSTSALPLRKKMLQHGTITHMIDGGEEKVFPDADVPALVIFRYQKTVTKSHKLSFRSGFTKDVSTWETKYINNTKTGLWWISEIEKTNMKTIGDYFDVKVGIVSGADGIFNVTEHEKLNEFTQEGSAIPYVTTKGIEWFIDVNDFTDESQIPSKAFTYLSGFKDMLISRKISKFSEKNWWKYGAIRNKQMMLSDRQRIYTFGKTRNEEPFFENNDSKLFSGGIIALFLKPGFDEQIIIPNTLVYFNSREFRKICEEFGITTGSKVSFQPATLSELPFII